MSQPSTPFNDMPRYVRVRSGADDAFVEFDFAIGYPELYVELVLPRVAFEQFCTSNRVQHMNAQMSAVIDADMQKWRYGNLVEQNPSH
ncbi:phenol hydroxylase subunit [Pseudomonas sp. LS1212]|uniref:phenol hydroxylase subunit n=1 Tax=Pseudomonas sp. LS1212 TaxID=2972478 RepID=UPI00215C4C90|nr:phenol hydroxylase subunit [Pseudomonas sp. LS1212]UVJ46022.1 phenol hydroxylase subunit [Pseudomonas sp. LS1212]